MDLRAQLRNQETQLSIFLMALLIVVGAILTYFYVSNANPSALQKITDTQSNVPVDKDLTGNSDIGSINLDNTNGTGNTLGTDTTRDEYLYQVDYQDCCLWTIAQKLYGDPFLWPKIQEVNKLTNDAAGRPVIRQGDTLNLPQSLKRMDQPPTFHTVQSGDTLWDLAVQYYGDGFAYHKIMDANNIGRSQTTGNPLIDPGMVLEIPV